MGVAVRLHKTKNVLDPRRLVLDPKAQRVAVRVQATGPETLDAGVQIGSLFIVGGILGSFRELRAHALKTGRIIPARQRHGTFPVGKTETLIEGMVVDGREEHLEVIAVLCFADSRVLGEDGIALENLGHHLNFLFGDAEAQIVGALSDVAGIPERIGGDGGDEGRDLIEKLRHRGRLGGEMAKKLGGYIGHKLLIARALVRRR